MRFRREGARTESLPFLFNNLGTNMKPEYADLVHQ